MLIELALATLLSAPLAPHTGPVEVEKCQVFADVVPGKPIKFGTDCHNLTISLRGEWLVVADANSTFLMRLPSPLGKGRFSWHWGDFLALAGDRWIDVSEVETKSI